MKLYFAYLIYSFKNKFFYFKEGMISTILHLINSISIYMFWPIIFFSRGNLNGYTLNDVTFIYGHSMCMYSLFALLAGGMAYFSYDVIDGSFESNLFGVYNPIFHAFGKGMTPHSIFSIIVGLVFVFKSIQLSANVFFLYMLALALSVVCLISFIVIAESLTFWLNSDGALSKIFIDNTITFSNYPKSFFDGPERYLFYTLFPAGIVAYLPHDIIYKLSWIKLSIFSLITVFIFFLASLIFRNGLKRYATSKARY